MSTIYALPDVYFRPKGQLLKWVGNKYNYAEQIVSYFPQQYNRYIEPFVGTGAVLATLSPEESIATDVLKPLIEIWEILQRNPQALVDHYTHHINLFNKEDRNTVYAQVRERYNKKPNGLDLLILSRTCYGGVVRFTRDSKMSTPLGPHKPIPAEGFEFRVYEWRERVQNTTFLNQSFEKTMAWAEEGDLIYCDPPYVDSQSILYGAQDFKFNELINQIRLCKERGVKVALSIDGKKKSGEKNIHLNIIKGLFEREIYLDCGSSMLRRLQKYGETMIGEDVNDRLLLTW